MSWLISFNKNTDYAPAAKAGAYKLHDPGGRIFKPFGDDVFIGIDGYVIPRHGFFDELKNYSQHELIYRLYQKEGKDLIRGIKGFFNIIIIDKHKLYVFNDRHSLKKFFYHYSAEGVVVSGDIETMLEKTDLKLPVDKTAAAVFCLMEHFIGGRSLFEGLHFSKAAFMLQYTGRQLQTERYWDAMQLLDLQREHKTIEEISDEFASMVEEYVDYLKPGGISLTLTGGNDSRFVLAALLNRKIKPQAFTFGSPVSRDVEIALQIAERTNIQYNNYHVADLSPQWFKEQADEIIRNGNTLVNIHRAHRLDAADREKSARPSNNMIMGGFMGGEYTKGVTYDNYIIPAFLKNIHRKNNRELKEEIAGILRKRYFLFDDVLLEEVIYFLDNQKLIHKMKRAEKDLFLAWKLYAVAHHTQDPHIFAGRFSYSVNPFMDVDFMELLFKSSYSLKYRHADPSFKSKLFVLGADHLAPELSDIRYGKKGGYTAREMKAGTLPFYFRRLPRYFRQKKYPPNFPYGEWMQEYCSNEISAFSNSGLFDLQKAMEDIRDKEHHFTEGYWHNFTNLINIKKNLHRYGG